MADPTTLDREQLLDVVRKARNTNAGLREIIQHNEHDFAELRRLYEAALAENDVLRRQVQTLQRELAEERSRAPATPPQYSSSSSLVSAAPAEGITFVTYGDAGRDAQLRGLYVMADAIAPGLFDRIPRQNYVSIQRLRQGAPLLTRDVIYVGFWATERTTTSTEANEYFDLLFSLGARSILLCYIGSLLYASGNETAGDSFLSQTRYRSDPRVSVVTLSTGYGQGWDKLLVGDAPASINRRGAAQIRQWVQEHQK